MTTPGGDLTIRARLLDEASKPIGDLRKQLSGTAGEVEKVGKQSSRAAADVRKLEKAAGSTSQEFNRAAKAGEAFGTSVGKVASGLLLANRHTSLLGGTLRQIGFAALGAEAVRFATNAVQGAQQAQVAFTGFLGSGEAARKLYADLGKMQDPFGTATLAAGAQSLLAYGVAADQVVPGVQSIADAVAQVGGGQQAFSSVASTLGDIRSSAKLTADQIRQLQGQGIAAGDILGGSRGLTGSAFTSALDRGAIAMTGAQAYDALIAGMESRAAGSAEKASQTLSGTFATIGDTLSEQINKAVTPEMLAEVTKFVGSAASLIPPLAQVGTPFLHVLGDTLGFLGDHPHVTEALAGFLVFREVAGATSTVLTNMRQMSALSFMGLGGFGGGGGGGGGGGDGDSPADLVNGASEHLAGTRGGTILAAGGKVLGGVTAGYTLFSQGGSLIDSATGAYGNSNPNDTVNWRTAGHFAAEVGKDAGAFALVGGSIGSVIPVAGTAVGAAAGAVAGTGYGIFKESLGWMHDKHGYALSSEAKAAQAAAQAPVMPQFNVQVSGDAGQQMAAMRDYINSPEFARDWQAQYQQQQRSNAERGRGGN